MLKKLIMAGALSLGALGFGTAGQALAGTDIDIGIGVGGGGYYRPGPSYYGGGRISCRQGARIVASAGRLMVKHDSDQLKELEPVLLRLCRDGPPRAAKLAVRSPFFLHFAVLRAGPSRGLK